jgi:hypothetical protein
MRIGTVGSGYYKTLSLSATTSLPDLVGPGDRGTYLVYDVFSNSSKSQLIGRDVYEYKILTTSMGSSGEFQARIEYTMKSYNSQGLLIQQQTSTDDVGYSLTLGAGSRNISLYVDDLAGTTTSRLQYIKL